MSLIAKTLTALLLLQSVTASPTPREHRKGYGNRHHSRSISGDVPEATPAQSVPVVNAAVVPDNDGSGYTPAAASAASSVVPAVVASGSPAPAAGSSGGKRGISYNKIADLQAFSGQNKIGWTYNWYSAANGDVPSGITYYPMLWSSNADHTSAWFKNAKAAIAAGADTLLAFNEPDHAEQAHMEPGAAAAAYKQYMQPFADGSGEAGGSKARLCSPAVTNGGAPMGLDWLQKFIGACSGCKIDVIAIHWYGLGSDPQGFINHVKEAYAAGGNRPIWVTEFAPATSDPAHPEVIENFFKTVLPFLDSYEGVEKYAYFFDAPGAQAVTGGKITSVGSAYAAT